MLKGVVVVGELELFDGVVAYFVEDAVEVNCVARWRLQLSVEGGGVAKSCCPVRRRAWM